MVTLITEQLRKQSLEEPYYKAFSFNVVSWIQHFVIFNFIVIIMTFYPLGHLGFIFSCFVFKFTDFCFSPYLQLVPVQRSRGVLVGRRKASL